MWSGQFYLAMPWLLGTVVATGAAGADLGTLLERTGFLSTTWRHFWTSWIPVVIAFLLAAQGTPADTDFVPDAWAAVQDYRGGCLSGTEYTDPEAVLSISRDVVTLTGTQGGELRFIRTGQTWPSLARAEIWGLGVVPRDHTTRAALAAVGCD